MAKSKLSKEQMLDVQLAYFAAHPSVDHLYFAEDGMAFFSESPANNYAGPKELKVERVKRPILVVDSANSPEEQRLLAFELNAESDWDEIREIGKEFNVSAKSKQDYIDALLPIQVELQQK